MTDLARDPDASTTVGAARHAAETAARTAGIDIRTLDDVADLEAVRRLYEHIWRTGESSPPVTADLLKALAKAGSYVSGAYDDGELVGACFGFFAAPARACLHSHIAGVLGRMRGRNVGFALKLHQRAWALSLGAAEIAWTFDPLVRRNASFNMARLGAVPTEYLPDFYGPIDDAINRSDPTDRLLVRWSLESPGVVAACGGEPTAVVVGTGTPVALGVSATGRPVSRPAGGPTVLVGVPPDIEALRERDPRCASAWRAAVREVLGGLLEAGATVRGFDRAGWYVLDTTTTNRTEESP